MNIRLIYLLIRAICFKHVIALRISDNKTRGMADLACNRFSKLIFDGIQYTSMK